MGPAVIPLALAAVGTGVNAYEQNSVANRQNSIESQSLDEQQQLKNKALTAVNNTVGGVNSAAQQAAALKAQDQANFTKQLIANSASTQAAQGNPSVTGAPAQPGASSRYAATQASGAGNVADYARGLSGAMSSIGGTQQQLQSQGADIQNTANQVSTLQQQSAQDSFVKQLQAQGIMENPYIKGAATAAQIAGMAMSGMPAGGAGVGVATPYDTAVGAYTAAGAPIAAGGTDIAPSLLNAAKAYTSAGAVV